ncbi:MAG: hypothetical protein ABGX27_08235 [Desulfurobacteriaceae bacterium]
MFKELLFIVSIFLVFINGSANAGVEVDPFVNPYKKLIELDKNYKKKEKKDVVEKVSIFKTSLNLDPDNIFVEGVIRAASGYKVVVKSWDGSIYTLSKGTAISPDTKLVRVSFNKVVFIKFFKLNGRMKRKFIVWKVVNGQFVREEKQ